MDLPDMEIPELPNETSPSTSGASADSGVPTINTGDYVTSLGMVLPLPEKDLEIAPDLLQRDPDIMEIEQPETKRNKVQLITLPCSINLRRLDQQDINMWQMQKAPVTLPDATVNSVSTNNGKISKYNLHLREPVAVNKRPQCERPH